jgi:hypothetical protein
MLIPSPGLLPAQALRGWMRGAAPAGFQMDFRYLPMWMYRQKWRQYPDRPPAAAPQRASQFHWVCSFLESPFNFGQKEP